MSSKMQPKKQVISEESVEAKPRSHRYVEPTSVKDEMKTLWDDMLKSTKQDVFGGMGSTFSEQILGLGTSLQEGQAVSLGKKAVAERPIEKKPQVSMEHMEYFKREVINADRIGESRTEREVRSAVEQIRMEIQKLIKTSKIVERTVKDATADKAPIRPGKYHLNFFEFVLGIIKDATRKLEDSVSYGAVLSGKKQQSKYWSSYKKHGTSFGLSGERTTATQTG